MLRAALLLVLAGVAAAAVPRPIVLPPPPSADPFPIRRTYLVGEPLAAALAQVARGELVKLPRDDFEAKVRAAARAPGPPRLAESRYRASLTEGGLVGTGEWRVVAAGPGLLPLDPLRVAVCAATWTDGPPAHLVRTGQPATPHLVVSRAGDRAVSLNWSCRGTEEPVAEQFDLTFPTAPVAALELDLPADRVPSLRLTNQLLTGPLPGSTPDRRMWRIAFGGQSRVELSIRRPRRDGEPGPLARTSLATRFDLAPGVATCTYEFDYEAVRGQPQTWTFETDPGLTVTSVTGSGRLTWRAEAFRVFVTPQEPVAAGKVTLTGFAALAGPQWTGPRVRLLDAIPKDDTLELRIDADLKFTALDPGDYRVLSSGSADRGYRVALTAALLKSNQPNRRLPSVHVRPAEPDLTVTEDITWRLGLGTSDVTARFRGRVVRGPVAQLRVKVSPDLAITGVRLVPEDAELTWALQPGGKDTLQIEPGRPLATGQAFELILNARGPAMPTALDAAAVGPRHRGPFPQMAIVAAEREGIITIVPDPTLAVWANPDPSGANLAYPYRGRSPDGTLTVAARPPRLSASNDTTLSLDGNDLVSTTRFPVRIDGVAGSLTFAVPEGARWEVRAEGATTQRIVGGELVPWMAALASPWVPVPRMELWRVSFPTPRTGEVIVTLIGRRPVPPDGASVALPQLWGASGTLFPVAWWRSSGTAPVNVPTGGWAFADVELLARLVADDRIENRFTGTVVVANGSVLPLQLPDGATVTAVLVAGKHLDHLPATPRLLLPVAESVRFEVRYTLPTSTTLPFTQLVSPAPRLPGNVSSSVKWSLTPEFRRWPELDTPTEAASVTVVTANVVAALGYGLAAIAIGLAVGLWFGRAGFRWRAFFAAVVALLGVAAWTVPPGWLAVVRPPLVAGLFALAPFVAFAGRRPTVPRPGTPLTTTIVVPLTLVFVVWSAAVAQAPEPVVVYVVPGPNRLEVLAPPAVLDRLDLLARPPLPATAILRAEYDGVAGPLAAFTATFRVLCTRDGEQVLNLPLMGVRLESLDLDGKPAFPDASRADRYAVTLRGQGEHTLTAKFVVPSVGVGPEREVRFGVPDVPCSKVRFAGAVDVLTRRGVQTVTAGKVEVDHGGGRTLAVRWRDGMQTGVKPTVTVREACVWDLGEASESATATFQFRITGGAVSRLAIEIPDGLEPARPVVGRATLREWRLDPGPTGWRVLTLQLQAPAEGLVTVSLKLYPLRLGLTALRFPRAIDVTQSESYFALRLDKVTSNDLPRTGVIDLTTDALTRDFGDELGGGPFDSVFRRGGTETPEVRPVLRAMTEAPTGSTETVWTCGPRVEGQGTVQATRPGQTNFEFELPAAVQLHSLRCPELHAWGRVGSRVQVWLRKPTRDATVRWTGSLATATELPFARLVGSPATLKLRAADGWAVVPQQPRGLKPLPARTAEELAFEAEATAQPLKVALLPPVAPRSVQVTESVEKATDGLRYRALVRVPLAPGRPHHFTLKLTGLPAGVEAEVRGPEGVRIGPAEPGPSWEVVTPSLTEPLVLTVTLRVPLGAPLPTPEVTFGGPPVTADRTMSDRTANESPRETPPTPTVAVSNAASPPGDTALSPELQELAAALAWLAGLAIVLASAVVVRASWWPERLAACGLLGAVVVGTTTTAGLALLAVAAMGLLGRLAWAVRVLARLVLR